MAAQDAVLYDVQCLSYHNMKEAIMAATCNIRMDERLKEQFDSVAAAIGVSTSTAFNVFARQFVAHRGFPFDVKVPEPVPIPTEAEAVAFSDALAMEALSDAR